MSKLNYLANQLPTAMPIEFEFEGKIWRLWPLDHPTIAMQLEGWVVRRVARNTEMLRPEADDEDPVAWDIYHRRARICQDNIERGMYGAFSAGWEAIINSPDVYGKAGFAEAVYQCVRFKCPVDPETKRPLWTREHVARLLANKEIYDQFWDAWIGFNYPKAHLKEQKPPPGDQDQTKSQSDGTT